MTAPTESHPGTTPSANGDLVNRVQQLRLTDQLGGAKRGGRGSWLPWVLCGMLALSWVAIGIKWYRASGSQPDAAGGGPAAPRPAGGQADKPVAAGEILLHLRGNLISSLQVAVSPDDVGARVTKVHFYEGKLVKKGDVLAELVVDQYRNRLESDMAMAASSKAQAEKGKAGVTAANARVAKAKAALEAAKARVAEAEANLFKADRDMERAKARWDNGRNISLEEYQQTDAAQKVAVAKKKAAVADVDAGEKEVASAEADVKTSEEAARAAEAEEKAATARMTESQRMVDNCTIKAPIDGTVLTKKADVGSLVNPLAYSSTSGSLCEIADLKKLEVEVDVPERQLGRLLQMDPKDPTRVTPWDTEVVADAAPNKKYRGYVDRIMPIADDAKNVVRIRVRVYLPAGEIPGSLLRPKMSIDVFVYNRRFEPSPNDQKWDDETPSLR
jgi:multidrug efflux pump subunit AcrA (membrane-fusion protein)